MAIIILNENSCNGDDDNIISVTSLNSLVRGAEPGICLDFQGSFCLEIRFWSVLLLLFHKQIYINSIKRHFVYLTK